MKTTIAMSKTQIWQYRIATKLVEACGSEISDEIKNVRRYYKPRTHYNLIDWRGYLSAIGIKSTIDRPLSGLGKTW